MPLWRLLVLVGSVHLHTWGYTLSDNPRGLQNNPRFRGAWSRSTIQRFSSSALTIPLSAQPSRVRFVYTLYIRLNTRVPSLYSPLFHAPFRGLIGLWFWFAFGLFNNRSFKVFLDRREYIFEFVKSKLSTAIENFKDRKSARGRISLRAWIDFM